MKNRIKIVFFVIMVFQLVPGCGGGGGGASSTGSATVTTGTITGSVTTSSAARTAAAGASNAAIVVVSGGETITTTADSTGKFTVTGVPTGSYIEVTATYGGYTLKGYYDVLAGKTTSKNIDSRTTAAAIVYKKLKEQAKTPPTSVNYIEESALLEDFAAEVAAGISGGNYSYNSAIASQEVQAIMNRIDAGASFYDRSAPGIVFSSPYISNDTVSDVNFRTDSFKFQIAYSDDVPMDESSLSVSLSMDGSSQSDISSYFSKTDNATLDTSNIYLFTRTLFDLPNNDRERTMSIQVSIEDMSGNRSTITSEFTVYPLTPPAN